MSLRESCLRESCFLFDIDGTLVDLHNLWEKTFGEMYQQCEGIVLNEQEYRILFSNPVQVGHKIILENRERCTPEKVLALAWKGQQRAREAFAGNLTSYVLPGAKELLTSLSAEKATLATATGNKKDVAEPILKNSGLYNYFSLIGCAEETTKSKVEIVERVLQQYANDGKNFEKEKTYLIGDTPSDIRAARKNRIISVAVATGYFSIEELVKEKPEYALKDLRDFQRFIEREIYRSI